MSKITKICVICGTDFEGPSNATQQDKCPPCQKIHLKELQAGYNDERIYEVKPRGRMIGPNTRAYFKGVDQSIADPDTMQEYLDCFIGRYLPSKEVKEEVPLGYYPTGLLIEFPDGLKKVVGKELVPA
jgi:hypothetical protein